MPDFGDFADDAKKLASEHPDQADQVVDKAGQFADQETGNRFDSEIQQGEKEGDKYLGGQGQGQQQPGQQQSQDQGQYGGDQGQGNQGGYGDQGQSDQGQGGGQYGDQNQNQGGYGDQGQGDQGQGGQY